MSSEIVNVYSRVTCRNNVSIFVLISSESGRGQHFYTGLGNTAVIASLNRLIHICRSSLIKQFSEITGITVFLSSFMFSTAYVPQSACS